MKLIFVLILLLQLPLFTMNKLAASEYLSPAMNLRKVKMRLLGRDPSVEEYREFLQDVSKCTGAKYDFCLQKLLQNKVEVYLHDPAFAARGVEFAHQLLYLKPNNRPYELIKNDWQLKDVDFNNSLDNLVRDIFLNNKSWNELFIANHFTGYVTKEAYQGFSEDSYFASHIKRNLKPLTRDSAFEVHITDPNLAAGFMITPRFVSRFYDTAVNSGRKRAAAIIRIGLCDEMFPVLEANLETRSQEDKIAQGQWFEKDHVQGNSLDPHSRRRDCMQCHVYRGIDHLAWTFRATEQVLATKPTPGRFTYLRRNGHLIDLPLKGIGDFAQKLIDSSEYKECQVSHFWRQFVGNDNVLMDNPAMHRRIVEAFERTAGRVQDFVADLVMLPEFRQVSPTSPEVDPMYATVQPILKKCDSCHRGVVPDFRTLPIGAQDGHETEYYLEGIVESVSLQPLATSKERTMPPSSSPWQPSSEELKTITNWIMAGAPDRLGKKHASENWLRNKRAAYGIH